MSFLDEVFPADVCSLMYDPTAKPTQDQDFVNEVYTWRRPRQFCSNPILFVNDAQPGDIEQGALGDCWLLSAMSVTASLPDIIKKLFVEADEKKGRYVVRLYYNNEWQNVIIDDRIPCNKNGLPAFGHCMMKNEIWVVILEKAIAKLLGGYEALHGGYLEEGVALLTGGRPERLTVNSYDKNKQAWRKDKLWEKLVSYKNENVLMGAAISSGRGEQADEAKGLVAGHAYGILDVRETNDKKYKMIKLRNPWGQFEWKGNWSDNSRKWTAAYKKELGHSSQEDGVFWMQFEDFCLYYDKITTCRLFNDSILGLPHESSIALSSRVVFPDASWNRKKVVGEWTGDNAGGMATKLGYAKNPHLRLTVKKAARVFLTIYRPAISMDVEAQYYRSGIGFSVHQGEKSDYTTIPSENSPNSILQYPVFGRYNSIELDLDPDVYIITPLTLHPNRRAGFVFEVYSPADIDLESIEGGPVREVPPSARNSRAAARTDEIVKQQSSMQKTLGGGLNRSFGATNQYNKTASEPSKPRASNFMTTYQFDFARK